MKHCLHGRTLVPCNCLLLADVSCNFPRPGSGFAVSEVILLAREVQISWLVEILTLTRLDRLPRRAHETTASASNILADSVRDWIALLYFNIRSSGGNKASTAPMSDDAAG